MKKVVLFILIFLSSLIYSQKQQVHLPDYNITGTVNDSLNHEPLIGSTVVLLSKTDNKIIKGTVTNEKGEFYLKYNNSADARLKISCVGHKDIIIDSLIVTSGKCNLGKITMVQETMQTNSVVIKGEKPMVEYLIDKEVINIDKVPKGNGTVADALQNSGLVQVDQANRTISLRGSNGVKILVNGKPQPNIEQTIFQMPSDYLDKVEIMTTPSSKYEAEGEAGIIDLIIKKNNWDNFNGSISLYMNPGIGTYPHENFNYKKDNLNFFTSGWGGVGNFESLNKYSINKFLPAGTTFENSTGNNSGDYKMGGLSLGVDYDMDTLNSFSISGDYVSYNYIMNSSTNTRIFDVSNTPVYNYLYSDKSDFTYKSYTIQGFYKRKFNNNGCELTTDIFWSRLLDNNGSNQTTEYSNLPNNRLQNNVTGINNNTFNINSDYVNPTNGFGKFDAGYKWIFRDRRNNYSNADYIYSISAWGDSLGLSNDFKYKESIFALYGTWSDRIWIIDLKLGLRAENTYANGNQYTTGENFINRYTDLFPTINLSHSLSPFMRLFLNATRRISRPRMEMINPFITTGPNSINEGNPHLQPTYSNIYEAGLNPFIKIYYTYVTGDPMDISTVLPDGRFYSTTANVVESKTMGTDLTLQLMKGSVIPVDVPDWLGMLNITLSYRNLTQTAGIRKDVVNEFVDIYRDVWSLNGNANLNLWEEIRLGIYCSVNFKHTDNRWTDYTTSWSSISLSRDFYDGKLSVSISGNQLFSPVRFKSETVGSDFHSSYEGNMPKYRSVGFSIRWNFNNFQFRQGRNIDDGRDKPSGGTQ